MAKTVIILGAGASAHANAPMMSQFVDSIEDELPNQPREDRIHFQTVLDEHIRLRQTQIKTNIDLDNIEALYGILEVAHICGAFPDYSEEDVPPVISSLRFVIARTIESRMEFPLSDGIATSTKPYSALMKEIDDRLIKDPQDTICILSFNYDIGVELAAQEKHRSIDFGLGDGQKHSPFTLLKLHGSINWYQRSGNSKIEMIDPLTLARERNHLEFDSNLPRHLFPTQRIKEILSNGDSPDSSPIIVPPSWNKMNYNHAIRAVWRSARTHLAEAQNIFVFGYSLPPTDEFFRYLLSIGLQSETRIRKFWVHDIDARIDERYRNLMSTGIQSRYRFTRNSFENTIIRALR